MTKNRFTPTDLAAVSDNPEWTADDFAAAVPFADAFPGMAATIRKRGAQRLPTKVSTTIRLSRNVVDHFRGNGDGWQSRIDNALKEWIATRAR